MAGTAAQAQQSLRQAEGVVRPATTASRQTTGPNSRLEKNPFDIDILRFPETIGSIPSQLHWIKFTPNIQEKSSYQVKLDPNPLSVADQNRAAGTSLAGSGDPFGIGTAAGLTAGFAALGAIDAAAEFITTDQTVTEATKDALSTVGKGAVKGVIAGAIVSQINLSRKTKRAAAHIALYMPDTVAQQLVNDYDTVSLTQALGAAGLIAQAGGSVIEGAMGAAKQAAMGEKNISFGTGGGGVAEAAGFVAEKTGAFGAGITDVLLFSAGFAQNPQVEVLFKSIQNREFLFDFKFVPKSKEEARTIVQIVNKFRFHAAPEIPKASNGRYFIPPDEFDIEFMVGQNQNKNLPRLSSCVLQGIDVNYGSAGQWTAFEDGMPVEISLQLRFKEVEILHKELITKGF